MKYATYLVLLLSFFCSQNLGAQCEDIYFRSTPTDGTIYLQTSQLAGYYDYRLGSFLHESGGLKAVEDPAVIADKNVMFANGFWIGVFDFSGSLKIKASTFEPISFGGNGYAYRPGPINNFNLFFDNACSDYDRPWIAYGYQIEQHLEDWNTDGDIDELIPDIMAWPAMGNPYFTDYHDFELPSTSIELAPFMDVDADGIYDPLKGDYPWIPEGPPTIPAQIIWSVSSDLTIGGPIDGAPLINQLGITTWFYECTDEEVLDGVIFTNYRSCNTALEHYFDVRAGIWMDPDLGCYTDDYIGVSVETNSVYTYNADEVDGTQTGNCVNGVSSFTGPAPLFSISFLTQDLQSFTPFFSQDTANLPGPSELIEFYRVLDGLRPDGSPYTYKFNGVDPVKFAFSENPATPDSWSMSGVLGDSAAVDVRSLASIGLEEWMAGDCFNMTIAYQLHDNPGNNSVEDFANMFSRQEALQDWFSGNSSCAPPPVCVEDCIWTGDTDANGIVDQFDRLPIGAARNLTGPTRNPPYDWAPRNGESWNQQLSNGTDYKHIDVNGDGDVDYYDDWDLAELYYKRTRLGYVAPTPQYPFGDDVYMELVFPNNYDPSQAQAGDQFTISVKLNSNLENLRGFAFAFEYDQQYISAAGLMASLDGPNFFIDQENDGLLETSLIARPEQNVLTTANELYFSIQVANILGDSLPAPNTSLRLQNLKGIDPNGNYLDIGYIDFVLNFPDIMVSTEEETIADLQIFPNPATDRLQLSWGAERITSIRIYSSDGSIVYQQALSESSDANLELNISDFPRGMYSILFETTGAKRNTKRFIKM